MAAAVARPAILFDLDGTLTDPYLGITRSIQFALQELGYPSPPAEELRRFIGPPLQVTFPQLLGSDDPALSMRAIQTYRQRYGATGKFENVPIEGMVDVVAGLKRSGYFLAVATSKMESYSIDIVEHFGFAPYFDAVHGSQPNGERADKGELIRHIVDMHGLQAGATIMVGDRHHDVDGARKNGVSTIGVLWGFGDRTELETAGAVSIVDAPSEIPAIVDSMLSVR